MKKCHLTIVLLLTYSVIYSQKFLNVEQKNNSIKSFNLLSSEINFDQDGNIIVKKGTNNPTQIAISDIDKIKLNDSLTIEEVDSLSNFIADSCRTCDLRVTNTGYLTVNRTNTIHNMIIESGGKVTLNNDVLFSANNIAINSNISGTGTLVDKNPIGSTLNGAVQQYLGSARNWYLTAPVSDATVPLGQIYYSYDESGNNTNFTANATNYWVANTGGTVLNSMKGYIAQPLDSTKLNYTGILNTGNKSLILSRTSGKLKEGFNLVANPYPSYLDWKLVSVANPELLKTAWFRTKNTSDDYIFATINVADAENPIIVAENPNTTITTLIPPMQAYWVRVINASESLPPEGPGEATYTAYTINNTMRKHIDETENRFKLPKQNKQQLIRLQVSNGINIGETVLFFNSKASNELDIFDSPKMKNNLTTVPEIWTIAETEELVINGMNQIKYDTEIPLGFSTLQADSFTISVSELNNFNANTKIILADNESKTEQDLTNGTSYNFESGITNTTARFSLIFRTIDASMGLTNTEKLDAKVFVNTRNHITIAVSEKVLCSIFDSLGQKLYENQISSPVEIIKKTFSSGVYLIKLSTNKKREVIKLIVH